MPPQVAGIFRGAIITENNSIQQPHLGRRDGSKNLTLLRVEGASTGNYDAGHGEVWAFLAASTHSWHCPSGMGITLTPVVSELLLPLESLQIQPAVTKTAPFQAAGV